MDERKKINILLLVGIILSLFVATITFILMSYVSSLLSGLGLPSSFSGSWSYVITLIVFLVVFASWIDAFHILSRIKELKESEKKGTVSTWVWIIGGILAGMIIFVIAYTQIIHVSERVAYEKSLESITQLRHVINELCWEVTGNEREVEVFLTKEIGDVYVSDESEEILSSGRSRGNYLCIRFSDGRRQCLDLECDTSMPLISFKPESSSLITFVNKILHGESKTEYELSLKKTDSGVYVEKE